MRESDPVRQYRFKMARNLASSALRSLRDSVDDVARQIERGHSFSGAARNMGAYIADIAEACGVIDLLQEQEQDEP